MSVQVYHTIIYNVQEHSSDNSSSDESLDKKKINLKIRSGVHKFSLSKGFHGENMINYNQDTSIRNNNFCKNMSNDLNSIEEEGYDVRKEVEIFWLH